VQERARRLAFWFAGGMLVAIAAVSAATPFLDAEYSRRWFSWPGVLLSAQVPILVVIVAALLFLSLRAKRDYSPFLLALGLFALGGAGLGVSIFPDLIPGKITIWDAAAPDTSLGFMLAGAVILIPIILAYTAYAYWIFRGKVKDDGYHA